MLHSGCLDRPTQGRYLFDGREVGALSEEVRRSCAGIGSASSSSFPPAAALGARQRRAADAVRRHGGERRARASRALDAVGLGHRGAHRPDQLSGGERQRVAIARAVVMDPAVLLADEPTGNLDRHSAQEVMELLEAMNRRGLTLVVVTHDPAIAERARRVIRMADGEIVDGS